MTEEPVSKYPDDRVPVEPGTLLFGVFEWSATKYARDAGFLHFTAARYTDRDRFNDDTVRLIRTCGSLAAAQRMADRLNAEADREARRA